MLLDCSHRNDLDVLDAPAFLGPWRVCINTEAADWLLTSMQP